MDITIIKINIKMALFRFGEKKAADTEKESENKTQTVNNEVSRTPSSSLLSNLSPDDFREYDNKGSFVTTNAPIAEQAPIQKPIEPQQQITPEKTTTIQPQQAPQKQQKFEYKPNIQITPKKPESERVFSDIADYASNRPIEIAYDLTKRYVDDEFYKLDIFSTDDDLKKLVSLYPEAKYLDMHGCNYITDFSPIANLKHLEELDLSQCANLVDVSFIRGLIKLRVLNIGITKVSDISPLNNLKDLEILDLRFTKVKDISVVRNFANLKDISLWTLGYLESLNGIQHCTELRSIDITNCHALTSMEELRNLIKLKVILVNYTNIADISPISKLVNLQLFSMAHNKQMLTEPSLRHFENLSDMRALYLMNRYIRTFEYFKNMTKMKDLNLTNSVTSNVVPLSSMTNLEKINISISPSILDISPLSTMTELKKIKINGKQLKGDMFMKITDISVVKYMPKLVAIESKFNNKIKDINSLYFCEELEEVHCHNCIMLEHISGLRNCKKLKEIWFNDCPMVSDVSFIRQNKNLLFLQVPKTNVETPSLSAVSRLAIVSQIGGPDIRADDAETITTVKERKDLYGARKYMMEDEPKQKPTSTTTTSSSTTSTTQPNSTKAVI